MPLTLTDAAMTAVNNAAAPLSPLDRDPFLRALAHLLSGAPQPVEVGTVARAVRSLQREFWQPPRITNEGHTNHNRKNLGPPIP
jgi:hypothetical protein